MAKRPGAGLSVLRERLGPRGTGVTILSLLLVAMAVPLVTLPAVRCEVFGGGCARSPLPSLPPAVTGAPRRPLTPLEAAVRGGYVALGDSFSSGEGAYAVAADQAAVNRCHRTSQSYVHLVQQSFRFAGGSAFWACSGATTVSFMKGKSGEPSQVGRVGTSTSLVTVSIGGNDVGFSRVLVNCVIRLPWSRDCRDQGPQIADRIAALRLSLAKLLGDVTAKAPSARVIVLGYPRLFSETKGDGLDNIAIADQQWLNARGRDLNELIRQAALEADQRILAERGRGSVEFVDAYSGFAGHEIGTADPYVNGLDVNLMALRAEAQSFHPTAAGYRRLGELVVRQIGKGPGRPLNQYH